MMTNHSPKNFGIPGFILMLLFCLPSITGSAQKSANKIISVIGRNRIILQSELEKQLLEMKSQGIVPTDSIRCSMLYQMILGKMLLEQAERDSVTVTDEDVEGQLENRLRYFIQLYGSKEKLEQLSGKTVYQIKEEFRDNIRDQMIMEKMQGQIQENLKVSAFYKKIPVDSLPFFPAGIEVGQIVINPPISPELEEYAHNTLERIRQEVVSGKRSFEEAAGIYSQDPGSRDNGGRYDGVTRNGPWAPEFVSAAFKLQNGEISPIFKTKFGYHIIQMVSRKGDEADLRHILIKPEVTTADFKVALGKLDSVYKLLISKKMTFEEAVGKFSTDEAAKRTGGMITDPTTGATQIDVRNLDPGMVLLIDSLEPGEYSRPHVFFNEMHEQSCRIVFLRSRSAPHKANLRDDYSKIQDVALAQKKQIKMQTWLKAKLPTYYLKIDPTYLQCRELKELVDAIAAGK